MSETERKPAPTAEQVAAARHWLDNDVLRVLAMGSMTAGNVRIILAALDAAEARAAAAERERDEARAAIRHREERLSEALDRGNKWEAACHEEEVRVAELAELRVKLDEAQVALKPFAECWNNFKAALVDDKRHPRFDPIACAFEPWRRASEILKEENRG